MALDPTARESNVRDSIKKYLIDNLGTTYHLMFDKGLATPPVQGAPSTIDRWLSINFGMMSRSDLSEHVIMIYCCVRRDNEGFKLAQMSDTVMGFLSDSTQTDGMRRITLYRSYSDKSWDNIGGILVQEVIESQQFEADDETKYKIFTVRLRWSSKI